MSGDSLSTHGHLEGGSDLIPIQDSVEIQKNRFYQAEKWTNKVRNLTALINIRLIRGGVGRNTVATPDETVFVYGNRNNIMVRKEVRDFIINVEDYRTGATAFEPERDDIIEEIEGNKKYIYKVLPTNNEPVFKFTGAYRFSYRVHTKLIDEEDI